MKKLSESVWGDIRQKSLGKESRAENQIKGNVNDMVPVDMGVSVLWADRDLEVNGEYEFNIDYIKDYAPNGWRRPTREEADELLHHCEKKFDETITSKVFESKIVLSNDYGTLILTRKNLSERIEYWELEKGDMDEYWNTFELSKSGSFVAFTAFSISKLHEKHRVRFVRDKQ